MKNNWTICLYLKQREESLLWGQHTASTAIIAGYAKSLIQLMCWQLGFLCFDHKNVYNV